MRAAVLCLCLLAPAVLAATPNPAFNFRPLPELPKKRSFIKKLFDRIDGGEMNGWAHPDGAERKASGSIHGLTLRFKIPF